MANLNKIIDELSKLTVVEAAELSKQLEEKWGVTAAAPAAAAPAAAAMPGVLAVLTGADVAAEPDDVQGTVAEIIRQGLAADDLQDWQADQQVQQIAFHRHWVHFVTVWLDIALQPLCARAIACYL